MNDVNGVLGHAGAGEVVVSLGEAWTMHHVSPGVRAKFGAWAKARARQEIESLRDVVGEGAYRSDLAVFQENCASGAFNWGCPLDPAGMGSGINSMMRQWEPQAYLIGLLLEAEHDRLPPERLAAVLEGNRGGFIEALMACLEMPRGNSPAPEGAKTVSQTKTTTKTPANPPA